MYFLLGQFRISLTRKIRFFNTTCHENYIFQEYIFSSHFFESLVRDKWLKNQFVQGANVKFHENTPKGIRVNSYAPEKKCLRWMRTMNGVKSYVSPNFRPGDTIINKLGLVLRRIVSTRA